MTKEKSPNPRKEPNPQLSFSLVSTSGKKFRVSRPRGLDERDKACYTKPAMSTSRTMQNLRNPDEKLWREVKAAAAMDGKTMTQWVEEACRKQLAMTKKSPTT